MDDDKKMFNEFLEKAMSGVMTLEIICTPFLLLSSMMKLGLEDADKELAALVLAPFEEIMEILTRHKKLVKANWRMLEKIRSLALDADLPEELKGKILADINDSMKDAK